MKKFTLRINDDLMIRFEKLLELETNKSIVKVSKNSLFVHLLEKYLQERGL